MKTDRTSIAALVISMRCFIPTSANMSPAQIERTLEQWKAEELTDLEQKPQPISDHAPIKTRREMVKQQINREHK
ncbi:hypothetical protein DR996_02680 [Vibrio owensii]|nr:hypothetical protein DR996_02680 [Vibrio owensii]